MDAAKVSTIFSSIKTRSSSSSLSRFSSQSQNILPFKPKSHLGYSISVNHSTKRNLCIASTSLMDDSQSHTPSQGGESFFRSVLASMEKVYLSRNPTANAILELVRSSDTASICYDHFAFRTFGVDGYGISSMAKFFFGIWC